LGRSSRRFATDFIRGIIGAIGGTPDFNDAGVRVNGSVINFLIVAAAVYFAVARR
jgi:large-conductance mechanosensitive channel